MFVPRHIVKALGIAVIGTVFALDGPEAQAQISGTLGGDLVDGQLMEDDGIWFDVAGNAVLVPTDEMIDAVTDGTSNTIAFAFEGQRRVHISADVTTTDPDGRPRTTRIIAILIGLFAPGASGLAGYAGEACRLADGSNPGITELRACALISRRFSAFIEGRRLAVSPVAVMAQTARGIAIWDPR